MVEFIFSFMIFNFLILLIVLSLKMCHFSKILDDDICYFQFKLILSLSDKVYFEKNNIFFLTIDGKKMRAVLKNKKFYITPGYQLIKSNVSDFSLIKKDLIKYATKK